MTGTKVEAVIADADVSWATFFRYFPRKEDVLVEGIARHFRDRVVVENGHSAPVIGLMAELLEAGQRRGEIDPDLNAGFAALTVVAGAMFPAIQAAAAGADPGQSVGRALDLLWPGLAADSS